MPSNSQARVWRLDALSDTNGTSAGPALVRSVPSEGRSHRLVQVAAERLCFVPERAVLARAAALPLGLLLVVPAVLVAAVSAAAAPPWYLEPGPIIRAPLWALFCFALSGFCAWQAGAQALFLARRLRVLAQSIVVDRAAGACSRVELLGGRAVEQTPLAWVTAVHLRCERQPRLLDSLFSETPVTYGCYALSLVLQGGSERSLVFHGELASLRQEAAALAGWLGCREAQDN